MNKENVGLYDQSFEHDNCGIGAVVNIKGLKTYKTVDDAEKFGVKDKEIVKVEINTDGRSLIFGDVVCRVSASYATAMHIDTDESNAAACGREVYGKIVK